MWVFIYQLREFLNFVYILFFLLHILNAVSNQYQPLYIGHHDGALWKS